MSGCRYVGTVSWYLRPRDPEEQRGFELIGAEVRRRRVALGWTQRVLEGQSGIDQTVISRIENGKQYGLRWSRFAILVGSLGGIGAPVAQPRPGDATRRPEAADLPRGPSHVVDLLSGSGASSDHADADWDEAG